MNLTVHMPYVGELRDHDAMMLADQSGTLAPDDVGDDPLAYWRFLAELWAAAEDFVLVEHDVRIAPGTVTSFWGCPEPWCACVGDGIPAQRPSRQRRPHEISPLHGYDLCNGWDQAYLRCNRFRRELMLAHPDLFRSIAEPNRYWLVLDEHSIGRLAAKVHRHDAHRTRHVPKVNRRSDIDERRAAYVDWAMTNYPDTWVASANGAFEREKRAAEAAAWKARNG